jgi:hypothetical protein
MLDVKRDYFRNTNDVSGGWNVTNKDKSTQAVEFYWSLTDFKYLKQSHLSSNMAGNDHVACLYTSPIVIKVSL